MRNRIVFLLAGVLLSAACDRPEPILSPPDASFAPDAGIAAPPHALSVLDWNVFIGADVNTVLEALATPSPADDLPALLTAVATFQETDWPDRAAAIVDEIESRRPHVVGLQEVSEIDIDLTGIGLPVVVQADFLATLQALLAARGLNYVVAGISTNIQVAPLPGIDVLDHDVVLVDADRVDVVFAAADIFTNNIGVVAPGVAINRGWVLVDAMIDGTTYRFVNTHLESGQGAPLTALRALQAAELVALIGAAPHAVLMGDLNEGDTSPMYGVLTSAGLVDVWRALRPSVEGLTCCHLPDLSDKVHDFDQRIDFVLTRGIGNGMAGLQGRIDRLGEVPADRIDGAVHEIWPSDHAGLAVTLVHADG